MKTFQISAMAMSAFLLVFTLVSGCTESEPTPASTEETSAVEVNTNFKIAPDEYADLSEESLKHMANLDFDKWGTMLSDDVEYYFPDGDAGTRTMLKGKSEVVGWFKNWKATSGIEKMTFSNSVHIPVVAKNTLNYSGLIGVVVMSYYSNEMVYNGTPVSLRMNFAAHYNDDKLIDRYYTYYDRTPIIESVKANVLKPKAEALK